jgi:BirA family transcriptional regulator, biotin operon repressor / biotin---[acetyl-CoA-carboxylase] ligase
VIFFRHSEPKDGESGLAAHTDAPDFARTLLPVGARISRAPDSDRVIGAVAESFFDRRPLHSAPWRTGMWEHLFVSGLASSSQYDRLIRLARAGVALPHGLACVAREGVGFQGFRGRSWVARPGNVHLTIHLTPARPIERFETIFMVLAAVSVIDAIDSIGAMRGRAGIRWVNDVVVAGRKVAGVLAHTQTRGAAVTSVVLGIGLNVETTPPVPPTAFVPEVGSLHDFAPGNGTPRAPGMLQRLLLALERNYAALLSEGYRPLVQRYRERSAILGRTVEVSSDDADEVPRVYASGRVVAIGDGLELRLAGRSHPITKGRLVTASGHRES